MTLPHIPAGVQTAADVAVFGTIQGFTLLTGALLVVTVGDFRDRMTEEATLGTWKHFPHFFKWHWEWEKLVPFYAAVPLVTAAVWFVLYTFAVGLTRVIA